MNTSAASDREIITNAAVFSELSYGDNKNIKLSPGNWTPIKFLHDKTKISSVAGLDNPKTGYQARAWVNTDTREIFVANTGTNDSKDAAGWLAAQRGMTSSQFIDALNVGLKIKELVATKGGRYEDYKVIVTGHSWGELIAQILSYTFGWRGVGFDGPGARAVISDPLYTKLTSELDITPVGKSDFISCNIKDLGPLTGGIVGHTGPDIPGTRQCAITTDRIIDYSALSIGLAIVAANPIVGLLIGRLIGGLAQHGISGLRSAIEKGHFSVDGIPLRFSTKALPYEYQDSDGNRLCTLEDAQGNPILDRNGQLLCQLTLRDIAGISQVLEFTPDGTPIRQTTTHYEQNKPTQTTKRHWFTDNVYQTNIYDANGVSLKSSHLTFGPTNYYNLTDFGQRSTAEYRLHQLNQSSVLNHNSWQNFTQNTSSWLLSGATGWQTLQPGWGASLNLPSNWLNPIGAFYDSQSTAHDHAPSIADKTPRVMNTHKQGLSAHQLAALDTNYDGQLSPNEAENVRLWIDINQDGHINNGELLNVNTPIKSADYHFYTRGNAQSILARVDEMAAAPIVPILTVPVIPVPAAPAYTGVPASYYENWRRDGFFPTFSGYFIWQPNQIILTFNNNQKSS
jgi:hypothetical protein